jgi:hypothetical protein
MSSVTITVTGSAGQAYAGAPLNLAVYDKCLGFFVLGGSLAASCLDHSGAAALVPSGLGDDDVEAGYLRLKAGAKFLTTAIPDGPVEIFAVAKTSASLSGTANLPVIAGTQSTYSDGASSTWGRLLAIRTNNSRWRVVADSSSDGTSRTSWGATLPDVGQSMSDWALLRASWTDDTRRVFIRDETHNAELQSATAAAAFWTSTRKWRIGSQYDTSFGGDIDIGAIAFYSPGLSGQQRADIVGQMRALALGRGGIVV